MGLRPREARSPVLRPGSIGQGVLVLGGQAIAWDARRGGQVIEVPVLGGASALELLVVRSDGVQGGLLVVALRYGPHAAHAVESDLFEPLMDPSRVRPPTPELGPDQLGNLERG